MILIIITWEVLIFTDLATANGQGEFASLRPRQVHRNPYKNTICPGTQKIGSVPTRDILRLNGKPYKPNRKL